MATHNKWLKPATKTVTCFANKTAKQPPFLRRLSQALCCFRKMNKFEKWSLIEKELMAAYKLLPRVVVESDEGYRKEDFLSYIKAKELLLAMEELDGVIEDNKSPCEKFWDHLIEAAKIMEHPHVTRYESIRSAT